MPLVVDNEIQIHIDHCKNCEHYHHDAIIAALLIIAQKIESLNRTIEIGETK